MNNPYDSNEVKQFNFQLGRVSEQIVRNEINRFDGYHTVKFEYKCPDYKIFINDELAGYAEVKTQKMRYVVKDTHLGYSFPAKTIDNYRPYDTVQTPLEFYVVDPQAKRVFWDYFRELEREREIGGLWFPFDSYAKIFNGYAHNWSIHQFRYSFAITDAEADSMQQIIEERDKFIADNQRGQIETFRTIRMSAYEGDAP